MLIGRIWTSPESVAQIQMQVKILKAAPDLEFDYCWIGLVLSSEI
jgi:hypothetical protein